MRGSAGEEEGLLLHYPTVLQRGCSLVVVYSRFYGHNVPADITPERLAQQVRTNRRWDARVYSCDGPIGGRTRGYIFS